jgi:hypothetical protein
MRGSGSAPLIDPELDPTSDQTPFLSNVKDAKKIVFLHFFPLLLTRKHKIKIYFLDNFLCLNFILKTLFQSPQHL